MIPSESNNLRDRDHISEPDTGSNVFGIADIICFALGFLEEAITLATAEPNPPLLEFSSAVMIRS